MQERIFDIEKTRLVKYKAMELARARARTMMAERLTVKSLTESPSNPFESDPLPELPLNYGWSSLHGRMAMVYYGYDGIKGFGIYVYGGSLCTWSMQGITTKWPLDLVELFLREYHKRDWQNLPDLNG